ncbi:MAG: nicotinamide mononucleotide transporter [Neisseriaceae bacterium]|nr:nicotinamide mononucleotide transporter [Neisseriaceae bacterium]
MLDAVFAQYQGYATIDIVLEIIASIAGVMSVVYASKNSVKVFPVGLISTGLFVYLLFKWGLFGDMIINAYYVLMGLYGWHHWGKQVGDQDVVQIGRADAHEYRISALIVTASMAVVVLVYVWLDRFNVWWAYVDTLTTGLFFMAMWLMTRKKIEHWLLWIVANVLSVFMYFEKGYVFTSIQYIFFTFIAIWGYTQWSKSLRKRLQTV